MKTILVPTDYSDTSKNAARYAIALSRQLNVTSLILYNAYQQPITTDPAMNAVEFYNIEDFRKISEEGMKNFVDDLQLESESGIEFQTISEFNVLSNGIEELCKNNPSVDLIVMGITGGGKLEEVLIGSNTIHVAKHTKVPLIIVPADAVYKPVKQIALATDFKQVVESTPVEPIKEILDATQAKLHVLHIDHNKKEFTENTPFESLMLDTLLEGYNPEYHFIDNADFTEGMNEFVRQNDIDLIVTIPKKHGLFEGLFKRSHTKMLAYHTHVPLMVIHE
jgi:nucleotide-binding universal stress UspA family protein